LKEIRIRETILGRTSQYHYDKFGVPLTKALRNSVAIIGSNSSIIFSVITISSPEELFKSHFFIQWLKNNDMRLYL
jgi:hypothetical protein